MYWSSCFGSDVLLLPQGARTARQAKKETAATRRRPQGFWVIHSGGGLLSSTQALHKWGACLA